MLSAVLIATAMVMPSVGKGGKLSRVRSAVKGQPSRSSSSDRGDREASADRSGSGRGSRGGGRRTGFFPSRRVANCCRYIDYPYVWGAAGYAYVGRADAEPAPDREPQKWAGRLAAESSYDFDGLVRTGVRGMLLTPSLLEVHFSADGWFEPLDNGEVDSLGLFGLGLAYRLGADEQSEFRIGADYRQFADATGGRPGIRFFADANLFLGKPWVLTFTAGAGVLGDAVAWDLRGTFGALFGPVEIYLGYDYERVGDIPLGGPVLGLQLWL